MEIKNNWKIKDEVSGLLIEVRPGKNLNNLHIENLDRTMNRDFFFAKDGKFDGTGSSVCTDSSVCKGAVDGETV